MGRGQFRIDVDGGAVAADGPLHVPLVFQGVTQVAVRGHPVLGIRRPEPDSLLMRDDGLVQQPLAVQGNAEVTVGRFVIRLQMDSLALGR